MSLVMWQWDMIAGIPRRIDPIITRESEYPRLDVDTRVEIAEFFFDLDLPDQRTDNRKPQAPCRPWLAGFFRQRDTARRDVARVLVWTKRSPTTEPRDSLERTEQRTRPLSRASLDTGVRTMTSPFEFVPGVTNRTTLCAATD